MSNPALVSFVFNSPTLIPWKVVESISDEDMLEAILSWQETKRDENRFRENEYVAEVDNPRLKMKIRRILRKQVGEGDNKRHQLIGIECYWWQDIGEDLSDNLRVHRQTPGAMPITNEKE